MVELVSDHGELLARHGGETISAGGKRLRPLLVCIACRRARGGERRARQGRGRGRTRARGDARARRRDRRRRPAPWASDGRRLRWAPDGAGDRRSAVLARLRRARCGRRDRADPDPLCCRLLARHRRADAARRRVERRSRTGALPRALPAEDRRAVPGRLRARRARRAASRSTRSDASASASASPSSCSTTSST